MRISDKTITLAGTDVDGDALTYNITTLPANGTLFQTSDGSTRGNSIASVPTTVSDTNQRIIYISAPDGSMVTAMAILVLRSMMALQTLMKRQSR